jgi:hypothetical protein
VAEDGETVTEQELRDALNRLQISDLLVQSLSTTSSLAFHRLTSESRDLDQARLAIEATRALLPLLPDDVGPIREALSQLQMAYAREAGGQAPEPDAGREEPGAQPTGTAPSPGADDPERAKARARIWTPGSG